MKHGCRKPSIRKSIAARTTGRAKRGLMKALFPSYGTKGMGIFHPIRSSYNKIYRKTTFGISDISRVATKERTYISREQKYENEKNGVADSYVKNIYREIEKLKKTNDEIQFFCTLNMLNDYINDLKDFENKWKFDTSRSTKIARYIQTERNNLIKDFITRYFEKIEQRIYILKTDNAKLNNVNKFSYMIERNESQMNTENKEYAKKLKNELISLLSNN